MHIKTIPSTLCNNWFIGQKNTKSVKTNKILYAMSPIRCIECVPKK